MLCLLLSVLILLSGGHSHAVRLYATLPSPLSHELFSRHLTKPPELSLYSPVNNSFVPGFGCCRGFNMIAPVSDWVTTLNTFTNPSTSGGFGPQGLANIIWPGAGSALADNWPVLAELLESRELAVTDLGGFVPGGIQQYDARAAVNYSTGVAILGPRFLGFDMGEQDVRYLWGYSERVSLAGPSSRFERLVAFRDFSDAIEERLARTLAALAASNFAVHHWLKTGFYTVAGAETSQSNGNAQVLYAFVRGAAKQYGTLWFGQVSIFNTFGHKIPGDPNPTPTCVDQSSHSDTCGTSYSLMKRLLYTQLAYDSAYFAFEGGLTYTNNSAITPIGAMQLAARAFFGAAASPDKAATLGVHVPAVAVMLDFVGGFVRPCDSRPQKYSAGSWGVVPWDAADALADAVLDTVWPGYRAGALLHNESGYIAPTPFGDAADVILSDALSTVLELYDTVVMAHRVETDSADVARRLTSFMVGGGKVIMTASTLSDLGSGFAGLTVGACSPAPINTSITLTTGSGGIIVETRPLILCNASLSFGAWEVLATSSGLLPVAVRVMIGNGSLTAVLAGNYGMSTARDTNAPPLYACGVDEPDSRAAQNSQLADFVRFFYEDTLAAAAIFDLGKVLAWVPKRESSGIYILTITNPTLQEAQLTITSRTLSSVAWVQVLPLDESEKGSVGYLPHGFEDTDIGLTTNTTLAGGDTLIVRVALNSDSSLVIPAATPPTRAIALAAKRLLRLAPGTGDLRRAILARPQFEQVFGGVLIDYAYIANRENSSLILEGSWLRARGISVAVDFSRATNLFPGLRLSDDLSGAYSESMAVFLNVISKMPFLFATDALVTLHNSAEIAPANFSSPSAYRESVTMTLRSLSLYGIRFHLRRSSRNDELADASLLTQAAFAANATIGFAPSLAYQDGAMGSDSAAEAISLFTSGAAHFLLASTAWTGGGKSSEGAPIVNLAGNSSSSNSAASWLRDVHAAAVTANAFVVIDAAFDESEVGRAGGLADARALEDVVGLNL